MQSMNDDGRHYIVSGAVGELGRGETFDDSVSGDILQYRKCGVAGFVNFFHQDNELVYVFIDATNGGQEIFQSSIDVNSFVYLGPTTTTTTSNKPSTSESATTLWEFVDEDQQAVPKHKGSKKRVTDADRAKKIKKVTKTGSFNNSTQSSTYESSETENLSEKSSVTIGWILSILVSLFVTCQL